MNNGIRITDPPGSGLETLQDIAKEAVRLHGADWERVQSHIAARMDAFSNGDKEAVDRALILASGYRPEVSN